MNRFDVVPSADGVMVVEIADNGTTEAEAAFSTEAEALAWMKRHGIDPNPQQGGPLHGVCR